MPSPFPGVDPYLEGDLWQEFHQRLANQFSTQLITKIAPQYVALLARRNIDHSPCLSVEIPDVAQRRLVTIIEILSPANKHGEGAHEYNARRLEILQTPTHLLEIDLLRGGAHIPHMGQLGPAPYYVFLSRMQRRPFTQIWQIPLRKRLPTVPVPLLPPDPDVPLDLQAAMNACFELVGYDRLLDYTQAPPAPPLTPTDAEWVAATLQAAGMRAS